MSEKKRIALIVDNPLRDIDGIALVAWQLALRGAEVFLVPMYTQGFDIPALKPDVVVANYTRVNNADLLKMYKEKGFKVLILDTEGGISRSAEFLARFIGGSKPRDFVDMYCVWGASQRDAFVKEGVMPAERVVVTGCPRYDFCAPQWRSVLAPTGIVPGYVLINTNFPMANPRFSASSDKEARTWKRVGYEASLATDMQRDATKAFESFLVICDRLAADFPSAQFVLRPHPFEKLSSYRKLETHPNFKTLQNGTVLSWLNEACLLIHQNCTTSIEAVMLGKDPVSLEWFNTPALSMPSPKLVSLPMRGYEALREHVAQALKGQAFAVSEEIQSQRARILRDEYAGLDGNSAARAADIILDLAAKPEPLIKAPVRPSFRGRIMAVLRRILGYGLFQSLRCLVLKKASERLAAKAFTAEQVVSLLDRISEASREKANVSCVPATPDDARGPDARRMTSGLALRLFSASPPCLSRAGDASTPEFPFPCGLVAAGKRSCRSFDPQRG